MMEYITEEQVCDAIADKPRLVAKWVRESLIFHYNKNVIQPNKTYLQISENPYDRVISLPAYIKGEEEIIGIKWIGSHSNNVKNGLPRASAIIVLNDPKSMVPKVIVCGTTISSMRTLALSMLALDNFMPENARIGIIGMGKLGRLHARMLSNEYRQIASITCFSENANFNDILGLPKVRKADTLKELLQVSDVLITTTCATKPYINNSDLSTNTRLIINLSLMDFTIDVIKSSQHIIVDDWSQNIKAQKIFNKGVDDGSIVRSQVEELGQVIVNPHKERAGRVFVNPLGMGIEDIYVANEIYKIICKNSSIAG